MTPFERYSELWTRAEQIGPKPRPGARRSIYVHEECDEARQSWFHPSGTFGRPTIRIHNPDRESPSSKPIDDHRVIEKLIALAHECGHAFCWDLRRDAWAAYQAAVEHRDAARRKGVAQIAATALPPERWWAEVGEVRAALSATERKLIVHEEAEAWLVARRLLTELGFGDWGAFQDRERAALRSHELQLGLDEPELGEVETILAGMVTV